MPSFPVCDGKLLLTKLTWSHCIVLDFVAHHRGLVQGVLQCGHCTAPAEGGSTAERLWHQLPTVMSVQSQPQPVSAGTGCGLQCIRCVLRVYNTLAYLHSCSHTHTTHTHTHLHLLLPCFLGCWAKYVVYCRRVRLGWWVAAHHLQQSLISSCQSLTPERSLLTRSHHRSGVPPGGLLLWLGQHLSTCFWMQCSVILQICPSHCKCLCLNWSSTGSSPVLSPVTVFRSMTPGCLSTLPFGKSSVFDVLLRYCPGLQFTQEIWHH